MKACPPVQFRCVCVQCHVFNTVSYFNPSTCSSMPAEMTMLADHTARQLLDFSQKLDINLLDNVVNSMYYDVGSQVRGGGRHVNTLCVCLYLDGQNHMIATNYSMCVCVCAR